MSVLDAVAERVSRGEWLSAEDARAVLASYDLIAIGMMGDEARRRMRGAQTTFVRVFEIHIDAPPESVPAGTSAGEFRVVGRPPTLAAAEIAVRAARRLAGDAPVTGFALGDLAGLGRDRRELDDVFNRLRSAGLDAVAELAIDDTGDVETAVQAARSAGVQVLRLTIRSLSPQADGTVSADAQLQGVERARARQEAVGG